MLYSVFFFGTSKSSLKKFLINFSDVRVPTNSEISNLLIPSNKEPQQQQPDTNRQMDSKKQSQDPMISSFTEHTADPSASYNLIVQSQQQQKLADNSVSNSSLTIKNSDNNNKNILSEQ